METRHRVGTFFILVGLALLVMFVGSIMSKETNVVYLFLSFAALFVAFLLRRNKPVNDSGRFAIIRRANERSRQRREDRGNRKPQNKPAGNTGIFGVGRRNHDDGADKNKKE